MDNAALLDIWDYCAWLVIWLALFLILNVGVKTLAFSDGMKPRPV